MHARTETEHIVELLELGAYMGPGERYLMLYEGILTITNRTGLACWPRGTRRTIAVIDSVDCVCAMSHQQWGQILGRLQRIRSTVGAKVGNERGDEHWRDPIAAQMPKAHPT